MRRVFHLRGQVWADPPPTGSRAFLARAKPYFSKSRAVGFPSWKFPQLRLPLSPSSYCYPSWHYSPAVMARALSSRVQIPGRQVEFEEESVERRIGDTTPAEQTELAGAQKDEDELDAGILGAGKPGGTGDFNQSLPRDLQESKASKKGKTAECAPYGEPCTFVDGDRFDNDCCGGEAVCASEGHV